MKVLGTGLNGLVGSRITELLENNFDFENISLSAGTDITDSQQVLESISKSSSDIVIHLAAKTNVDGCEQDKEIDEEYLQSREGTREAEIKEKKTAYAVNVIGTENVVKACEKTGKKIVYVSTDFVFDGSKEEYGEEDQTGAVNWYGETKLKGEQIVKQSQVPWALLRIAYPYRANFKKLDFVRAILDRLKRKEQVNGVVDHIFTPTFIDDLAFALAKVLTENLSGVFHLVGSQFLSPYEASLIIAKEFDLDENLILKITRKEYFQNKAERPFRLALKNDKIQQLGIKMSSFTEGINSLKKQLK